MALNEAAKEALWLKGFCEDLNYDQGAVKVNYDSQSAIFWLRMEATTKGLNTFIPSSISFEMSSLMVQSKWSRFILRST